MTTRNDITGDKIQSKTNSQEYRDNYEKIFGKSRRLHGRDDTGISGISDVDSTEKAGDNTSTD